MADTRQRAEEIIAMALRNPLEYDRAELAGAILDDLGSAGLSVVETWTLEVSRD